jgi:hypothetical protein
LLERRSESVRNSDLLDGVVEEVAEECSQFFGESVVETGGIDRVVGCGFVSTAIASDRAGFAATAKPTTSVQTSILTSIFRSRMTTICEGNSEVRRERIPSEERSSISPSPHRYRHR